MAHSARSVFDLVRLVPACIKLKFGAIGVVEVLGSYMTFTNHISEYIAICKTSEGMLHILRCPRGFWTNYKMPDHSSKCFMIFSAFLTISGVYDNILYFLRYPMKF